MSCTATEVVVVGGGIVGTATAHALAREGIGVTLVESHLIGGGATAAGMGHLVVMDDSPAQLALSRYSRQLWDEILEQLPRDCQWQRCGTLWVAADEEEMDAVRGKQDRYRRQGLAAEVLDAAALAEAEPGLRPGLAGGLLVPGDSVLYPPAVARWLADRARQHGAALRLGAAAVELTDHGVRLSDGSHLASRITVNAAGTWAKDLMPGLPLRPRKGHLAVTDRYPGFVRHQVIELGYLRSAHSAADSVAFNVQPRAEGQVLLGSSRQYGVETTEVEPGILSAMIARALQYMPGLAELSTVRCWTGLRAATDDKLPWIGPAPGSDRVYLATGHEGLGITTSLGTAAVLADQILGRKPAIPCEAYLPSRPGNGEPHG